MKILPRFCLLALLLAVAARADEAHSKAIAQVIESYARLDATFRAVHSGKSPMQDLAADLLVAKNEFLSAAKSGVSDDVNQRLRACAEVFTSTVVSVGKVTDSEAQKMIRCQDELGDLMRLTGKVGEAIGSLSRLSLAERKELGAKVEALFGKKVVDFPRGDTSPFASGSRSPFASSMWLLNLQFDVAVFSGSKRGV
ncbi:MAG: hypothetical protein EXS38_06200 [Opitutus sp.]|nr:hypothetical protein [Opitutus sp.]